MVISEDYTSTMNRFCSGLSNEITSGVDYNNFLSNKIDEFLDNLDEIDYESNKTKYDETFNKLQDYISSRNEQQEELLRKSSLFSYTCIEENKKRLDYYQQEYNRKLYEELE